MFTIQPNYLTLGGNLFTIQPIFPSPVDPYSGTRLPRGTSPGHLRNRTLCDETEKVCPAEPREGCDFQLQAGRVPVRPEAAQESG